MWQPKKILISLLQYSMVDHTETNLLKAESLIVEAAQRGSNIVCLPELFHAPYFAQYETVATDYRLDPEPIVMRLAKLAAKYSVVIITGSIYEVASEGRGYNTSYVIDASGECLGSYRKTHIPHDPGFFEANYFEPGDTGFKVFNTRYCKVAVLICFDQWFPEAARICALKGAEVIFYPTAIGTPLNVPQPEGSHQQAWEKIQTGHAIANSCIVAAVNRCGIEDECHFFGNSFISDAFGTILGRAKANETILTSEVDLEHSRFVAREWLFKQKRRPESYLELCDKK